MTYTPLSTLDAKLRMIRMLITDLEVDTPDLDDDGQILHRVMTAYEGLLIRSTSKIETTLDEVLQMSDAIEFGNHLLASLIEEEADKMTGWYHGIHPANKAMALANLLSRMTLELGKVVRAFRFKYPDELNPVFNRLAQYAS